jgi:hypothetical protein
MSNESLLQLVFSQIYQKANDVFGNKLVSTILFGS